MSDSSDDETVGRPTRKRHVQSIDERDGAGVGRRPRTAQLEYAPESIPIETPDEITDVHKLVERVLDGEEFTPSQVRLVAAVMDATWKHVNSADRRRMNGDLAVAAGKPPTETINVPKWWAPLVRAMPAMIAIATAIVTAILWARSATISGEREQADLRARLGQLEVWTARNHEEIQLLRASSAALWQRLNPWLPDIPAIPGDIP